MAQSTTNLGKIHVFPSETLYNQFKDIIADNDLALLKDDGAYIVAALLEQNGYVKFSNGLILQWGNKQYSSWKSTRFDYPISMTTVYIALVSRQLKGADKTEFGCTILTTDSQFLTFMGYVGTANIVVLGR